MTTVGWTRRSSNAGPFRASNAQHGLNDGGISRQSRSVERHSRIPLRSSSSQATNRCGPSGYQPLKDRSKSVASISGETPVHTGKMTPQSTFGSRATSSCSSNRGMKKVNYSKDTRNLHDKEFLKEASHVVQSFFQAKCPDVIVNGTDIRPMTIKMFIGMVNYLFAVLEIVDKRQDPVVFQVSTYEKELPYWMKKLNYPGLINKAWLQTVNVPNNWHHVIGLLSWMVKICQISALYDFEEKLVSSDPHKMWEVFFFKESLKAYKLFNEGKDEEFGILCSKVVRKYCELNEINTDEIETLQEEINKLEQMLENPNALAEKDEDDEAIQKLKNAELLNEKLINDIWKKENEIEMNKRKLSEKIRNCDTLKQDITNRKRELEELKNRVSQQPTSINDILELQRKSEYLDKEIKFLEKECEDLSELVTGYEFEAAGKRDLVLQATHAFNRNIIQLEQTVPELKGFRIYQNPEDEEIILEMEQTVAELTKLKKQKIQYRDELGLKIKKKEEEIETKMQAIKDTSKAVIKLEEDIEVKKRNNAASQNNFDEQEKVLKVAVENLTEKLKAAEEKVKEFNERKEMEQKLSLRYEELERALEKTEELAEAFWEKCTEKWKDIPNKLETLVKLVKEQNVELKQGYSELMTALQPK